MQSHFCYSKVGYCLLFAQFKEALMYMDIKTMNFKLDDNLLEKIIDKCTIFLT